MTKHAISTENNKPLEFSGERSRSYKKALSQFPNVWKEDMILMQEHFNPKDAEIILEIGAGSGFFSFEISQRIGRQGHLFVLDPSPEQLAPILKKKPDNISIIEKPADELTLPEEIKLDAIWSRGAIHHAQNKTVIFKKLYDYSKPGTRMVICDIFSGSRLANYFDFHVAKTCTTGHEVSYLSRGFSTSLCFLTGWGKPNFREIFLQWKFDSKENIGLFLSLLHSNKEEFTAEESLRDAEKYLGIKKVSGGYNLNWPMTIMDTIRT